MVTVSTTEQDHSQEDKIAIHTHDRICFKRCRLMWYFRSELQRHLIPKDEARAALWFGTGIHFALEDFHGYQRYSSPRHAFQAYYNVFQDHFYNQLPIDHEELLDTGHGILNYYPMWLEQRNEYKTLWLDGKPQVEVEFSIPIPELSDYAGKLVCYEGAFDRIVVDSFGRWWIMDYKTVKQFDTVKLETDAQVSAYCWAAEQYYSALLGKPITIEGMVYLQMKKTYPKPPRMTRQGLSVDKSQYTSYRLFKEALRRCGYGPKDILPEKYVNMLNHLTEQETIEGDRFIRWDCVRRNEYAKHFEYQCILMEGYDMLNPNVYIYPNPTKDCSWDCDYRSVHLAMMDGSDWEWMLEENFVVKEGDNKEWRRKVKWEDPPLPQDLQCDRQLSQ